MPAVALIFALASCSHVTPPASAPSEPSLPSEPRAFTVKVSGAGRPLVFIPDLAAPGEVWDSTVAHLGGRVEAHVVDVAGFAGNAATTGPLMPKLRDGLARYLRERHAKGAILVGHLFGATVAYWLAMTEPDLVGGVVAVDAPPSRGHGEAEETAEAEQARRALEGADPQKYARMVTGRLASMMADQERAAHIAEKAVRSSPPVVAEAFYDMMTRDLRAHIASIRAPVLAVMTTGNVPDEAWPEFERSYREQLNLIPRHELVVVRGSKHYVMFDAPETFFAHLDRFLAAAGR